MQRAILIQLLIPMEIAINLKLGGAANAMLSDDPGDLRIQSAVILAFQLEFIKPD